MFEQTLFVKQNLIEQVFSFLSKLLRETEFYRHLIIHHPTILTDTKTMECDVFVSQRRGNRAMCGGTLPVFVPTRPPAA